MGVRGLAHMVNGSNVLKHIARRTVQQYTKTTGPGEEAKGTRRRDVRDGLRVSDPIKRGVRLGTLVVVLLYVSRSLVAGLRNHCTRP